MDDDRLFKELRAIISACLVAQEKLYFHGFRSDPFVTAAGQVKRVALRFSETRRQIKRDLEKDSQDGNE